MDRPRESAWPSAIYATLLREQYEAHFAALRRVPVTLTAVAVFALFGGLAATPLVGRWAQQPLWPVVPLVLSAILIEIAMHRLYERLGALHVLHMALERAETFLITLVGVTLVGLSGSAFTPFWIAPLSQNLLCRIVLNRSYSLVANGTCYVGLVAAFLLMHKPIDALLSACVASAGMAAQWTLGKQEAQRLHAEAIRRQMRLRVAELAAATERARLARELHDGVAADMAGLLWKMRAEAPPDPGMEDSIRLAIAELRGTVVDLRQGDDPMSAPLAAQEVSEPTAEQLQSEVTRLQGTAEARTRQRRSTVMSALALAVPVLVVSYGGVDELFTAGTALAATMAGRHVLHTSDALRLQTQARAELLARHLADLERARQREQLAGALDMTVLSDLDSLVEELDALATAPGNADLKQVRELLALAVQAKEGLQAAVWDLQKEGCTLHDLLGRIRGKCSDLCTGQVQWSVAGDFRDPDRPAHPEVVATVVRIVQEAVRNALRHSQPSRIDVRMRDSPSLQLEIEDDGTGLSQGTFNCSDGGLRNLRVRAEMLGGQLRLAPTETGTLLVAELPGPMMRTL